jgi:hypothetical protein
MDLLITYHLMLLSVSVQLATSTVGSNKCVAYDWIFNRESVSSGTVILYYVLQLSVLISHINTDYTAGQSTELLNSEKVYLMKLLLNDSALLRALAWQNARYVK